MPIYRSEVEARRLDFEYPNEVADITDWCNGRRLGNKVLVDWEGRGEIARDGWYVVRVGEADFLPIQPGLFGLLFPEEVAPGGQSGEPDAWQIRRWCKEAGITGSDLTTAMNSWRKDPTSTDGCRVQSVIEARSA